MKNEEKVLITITASIKNNELVVSTKIFEPLSVDVSFYGFYGLLFDKFSDDLNDLISKFAYGDIAKIED